MAPFLPVIHDATYSDRTADRGPKRRLFRFPTHRQAASNGNLLNNSCGGQRFVANFPPLQGLETVCSSSRVFYLEMYAPAPPY